MRTSRNLKRFIALAAVVNGALLVYSAQVRFALPPETARLKAGPGAELAAAQCLLCHSADYIGTQPRLTRAQWKAAVQKMREKFGAPIPADKVEALVDYLTASYGIEAPSKTAPPAR
jgi:hypothetical protein